jgi:DNA-binding response OmpR family regulator
LRKIVIAEDDPISREILIGLLGKWGFNVIVANDGQEAMEALRAQTQPVLAILDWMMPGMEGTEICRRVREVDKSIYILLLTARAGKERVVEGLRAGADDYLTKPFDKDELRARLTVGARILDLQTALQARVQELEAAQAENRALKLQLPL